jgi:hypothetical protein
MMCHCVASRIIPTSLLLIGLVGCGNSLDELEKARQREAEASRRLRECQAELEHTRKALDAARKGSPGTAAAKEKDEENASWKAARTAAEAFLAAVNSRNTAAANAAGTKEFRDKNGGDQAIKTFAGGRFRGEPNGYTCAVLASFEAVPGQEEYLGRGKLHYRGVPRQDSTYTVRVRKEEDKWRVASFTAAER